MKEIFSDRINVSCKSFIREILKVTQSPEIISFAGGLPNPALFPTESIAESAFRVLSEDGAEILQYTTTEGYYPLRRLISERYAKRGLKVKPEEILITNGSQQGIDLVGRIFLNKGDRTVIEKPGYLGAIQALGMYEPEFVPVELEEDGINIDKLSGILKNDGIKLMYAVPNFQNPSGIAYCREKRESLAKLLEETGTVFLEDDAYGELRFIGEDLPTIKSLYSGNSILLGSFSKIVAPGLRLGWICAGKDIMEKLITAKQASDLHSNHLSQWLLYRYLLDNDIDTHIARIRKEYRMQRNAMTSSLERYLPCGASYTKAEGGMFLWMTLPDGVSSMELFDRALERKVAFVPGMPFYIDGEGSKTLRLNFTNSYGDKIDCGIRIICECIKELIGY